MRQLDGKTFPVIDANIEKLKQLFPEILTGNKVNFDKLRIILGDHVEKDKERYEFTWNGKTKAIQLSQMQSTGTLRPCKEESVNWKSTKNLYIEGDNLEVLRLLQSPYRDKVKLIYIDPPYNTGNDFVYEDNFQDNMSHYKKMMKETMKSNPETNGRYHTDWLNLMYPRLRLARTLLAQEGVIFISIDENEFVNLKKICDEVFGEENAVGDIIVKSNPRGSQSVDYIAYQHEHLLIYAKNIETASIIGHQLTDDMVSEYKYEDNGGKYRLLGLRQRGGFWRKEDRPLLHYPIFVNEDTGEVSLEKNNDFTYDVIPVQPSSGEEGTWRWSKDKFNSEKQLLLAKKVSRDGSQKWDIFQKDYLSKENDGMRRTKAKSLWDEKEMNYQNGSVELKRLFCNQKFFDYPKPTQLILKILEMIDIDDGGIVLDFFSGSATVADALMQMNTKDGRNRRFILVQLPERLDEKSAASKAGYKTICDIGKERMRRAGAVLGENNASLDIGFKVFKLEDTNLKMWEEGSQKLEQNLLDLVDPVKEGRTQEDVVYEILLKYGMDLAVDVDIRKIGEKAVYSIGEGYLLICLERHLTIQEIEQIAKESPKHIVFYDESFADDTVRTNAQQMLKRYGVEDIRVI